MDPATTEPEIQLTGLANEANDLTLTWKLFDGTKPRLTQFAQPNAVSANTQDGSAAAQLIKVGIADGGKIMAQYSNGKQSIVGQLAMASIRNPESLIAVGNSNFQLSARTALPAIGHAGHGRPGHDHRRRGRVLDRRHRPRVHAV